ncbi:MAG: Bax inhibitor-1/YccA family protein [Synechococcaceae bacterium WB8_1B_057]|nr:Bax inhibitor-1/YccA family protein [Synechococcaceae bacterium WB8_1B_057]
MYTVDTFESHYGNKTASDINSVMAGVYKHMGLAVIVSMLVAYGVGMSPELLKFFFTGITKWIVMFLPLVAVFGIGFALQANPPRELAQLMLLGFAAIMGLSFAVIFAVYQMASIFTAFMGAAVLFGVMSFYGYFTKKSLDSLGKFLFVGLIAIIIASIINIFVGSSVAQMVISALAILIFTGLTAYDTQKIREMIMYEDERNVEVIGALTLYMDFINIFLSLLQLFGDKKE